MHKGNTNVVQTYTNDTAQSVIANDYPLMSVPVLFLKNKGIIKQHTAMTTNAAGKWIVVADTNDKIEGVAIEDIDTGATGSDIRSGVYQSGAFVVDGIGTGSVDYGSDAVLTMNELAVKPLFFVESI